jgi:capsular polysaccharide biosynthesis protein
MDLLTALKILLRRWPVVLAGLAITVFGFFQIGAMIAPTYEAKSTVLLLSPGSSTTNPFNEFGGNLDVTADALMVVLQSPSGAEKLERAGVTGTFKLERTSGPLIDITAKAASKVEATKTVETVVQALKDELALRQAASPVEQRITVSELTLPVASPQLGSRIRAQFVVVAIGLTGTVAAALAADAIMRQRHEGRLRRQAEAEEGDEDYDDWEPPVNVAPVSRVYQPAGETRRSPTINGSPAGTPVTPVVNGNRAAGGASSIYRPAASRPRPEVTVNGSPLDPAPARHLGDRAGADRRAGEPTPDPVSAERTAVERGSAAQATRRPASHLAPSEDKVDEARRADLP